MYEIDKYDLKIVQLLMKDGRMSASELAREIGDLSERSIRYRINRMVKEGGIKIRAIVNPKAFGYNVIADIWVEVESSHVQEVAEKIAKLVNVSYLATSIGEKDISVQIYTKDNTEVYTLVTEVIGCLPGVRKTVTSIVPIVLKDVYDWCIPPESLNQQK
jgi:Lrp/AsnC family transcriptional regulator for asnA, asnC and gidA